MLLLGGLCRVRVLETECGASGAGDANLQSCEDDVYDYDIAGLGKVDRHATFVTVFMSSALTRKVCSSAAR